MISAIQYQLLLLVVICVFLLLMQNLSLPAFKGMGIFSGSMAKIFQSSTEDPELFFYVKPRIDTSKRLNLRQIANYVQQRNRYLPIILWERRKRLKISQGYSCVRFPEVYEQEFSNEYWQLLRTKNRTFYLYGAYYDNRSLNSIGPTIRILGMINEVNPTFEMYCQIWFEQIEEPIFTKVIEYNYIWMSNFAKEGSYQPYLMTCPIPKFNTLIPSSVSLVENRCDQAKNNLRIIYTTNKEKQNFAVCVKSLDYVNSDVSFSLVEWIELLRILGADKIFFYYLHVHPKMLKVLEYYAREGLVDLTPLTLPGGLPNIPKLRNIFLRYNPYVKKRYDLISINDCLYRNIYAYKYIIPLDLDEVILPTGAHSWEDLLTQINMKARQLRNKTPSCYCGQYVNFLENTNQRENSFKNISNYMHMLRRVHHIKHSWNDVANSKCFHNTHKIVILHNNFPIICLGSCSWYPIDVTDAKVQHYSLDCKRKHLKQCLNNNTNIYDPGIWRFRSGLINNTLRTLHSLKFLT